MNGPDIPPEPPPPLPPLPPPPPPDESSPRTMLLALVFVALLVLGGLYLVHTLRRSSALEDCLMQGRSSCSPIDGPSGSR